MKIQTAAAGAMLVLLTSAMPAKAQETYNPTNCVASLRYTTGGTIDPQNLRVGETVTDGTFVTLVYPTMTPEAICRIFAPGRLQIQQAEAAAIRAEGLRVAAVTQGEEDRNFRIRAEKDPIRRDPYAAMGAASVATLLAVFVVGLFWRVVMKILKGIFAQLKRRNNRGRFSKRPYAH